MEVRSIFEAVIHDVYLNSISLEGHVNKKFPYALIVEASPFLVEHMANAGRAPRVESFIDKGRTFVVFRESEETVSRYTPGDIINVKAAQTPDGLRLCL